MTRDKIWKTIRFSLANKIKSSNSYEKINKYYFIRQISKGKNIHIEVKRK